MSDPDRLKVKLKLSLNDQTKEFRIFLTKDKPFIIGRNKANLKLNSKRLSGQHCKLVYHRGIVFLEDMGSTNGTFINTQKISKQQIGAGDLIRIGGINIELEFDKNASNTNSDIESKPEKVKKSQALAEDEEIDLEIDQDEDLDEISEIMDIIDLDGDDNKKESAPKKSSLEFLGPDLKTQVIRGVIILGIIAFGISIIMDM